MSGDKPAKAVWVICQYAGSPRHGMNYRPYNIGQALKERGFDVTIISGSWSHQFFAPPRTEGIYTLEDVDGLRYCWIRTPAYPESHSSGRVLSWLCFLLHLFPLGRRAKALGLPKPDSIIISSPSPYPVLAAARLARYFAARLVFEVRDLWPLSLIELGGYSARHPFMILTQWIEDFAYRHADRVVSVLPVAESYMLSRGMAPGKFVYIPNGITASDIHGVPCGVTYSGLLRAAFSRETFIIGYSGTLGLANALTCLVDAAALLKDNPEIGFAIIGEGAELAALKRRCAELGTNNVVFFPSVPKQQIPDLLAQLDACYLGLRAEAVFRFGISPTKLFDYLLAARPVIMAIDAGNDIVAEAGCGITVPPEDPTSLAAAVKRLASISPSERASMGAAGRAYVLEKHHWSVLGERYVHILNSGTDMP